MRLIDADALIKTLETQDYSNAPDTLEEWTPQDLTNAEIFDINNAPTVDAVEVVRCKDCLWRGKHGCYRSRDSYTWYNRPKDDDFCSWGERREDETD